MDTAAGPGRAGSGPAEPDPDPGSGPAAASQVQGEGCAAQHQTNLLLPDPDPGSGPDLLLPDPDPGSRPDLLPPPARDRGQVALHNIRPSRLDLQYEVVFATDTASRRRPVAPGFLCMRGQGGAGGVG